LLDLSGRMALAELNQRRPRLQLLVISRNAEPAQGDARLVTDPDGRISTKLGVDHGEACYLVRPDQHICGRWRQLDAACLRAAMHRALARA
jgi:3-(3-hydroxy-phenyl)propionate hydroxylase